MSTETTSCERLSACLRQQRREWEVNPNNPDRKKLVKVRAVMNKHGLHDWTISFENLRNALYTVGALDGLDGLCDLEGKEIKIDHGVGRPSRRPLRQVVLHEIAQALRGPSEHDHDQEWINVAEGIGCTFIHLLPYQLKLLGRHEN